MRFDDLLSFDTFIHAENAACVTKPKDVYSSIISIKVDCAIRTAQDHFAFFKEIMYLVYGAEYNAAFFQLAKDTLDISDELINVHCKMSRYLHENNFFVMDPADNENKDKTEAADEANKSRTTNMDMHGLYRQYSSEIPYKLNIPTVLLPLFSAYILACGTKAKIKRPRTVKQFFLEIDSYLKKDSALDICKSIKDIPIPIDQMPNLYHEWMNYFLGRDYFYNLEAMLTTYSTNSEQRSELKYAVALLTNTIMPYTANPYPIVDYMCFLLNKYTKGLGEKPQNSDMLYRDYEPLSTNYEKDLIESAYLEFKNTFMEILSFISNYLAENHRTDSVYPLSVPDFRDFETKYNEKMKDAMSKKDSLVHNIQQKYIAFTTHPKILSLIQNDTILLKEGCMKLRISALQNLIEKSYTEAKKATDKYSKDIGRSSKATAVKSVDIQINQDKYEDSLYKIIHNLKETIQKKLDTIPPFVSVRSLNTVQKHSYPRSFDAEDIRHISSLLSQQMPGIETDPISQRSDDMG